VRNIFTEQPWIADTGPIAPALSGTEIALNSRRSALKVLLSVVSIFFLLMILCGLRRAHALPGLEADAAN